MDVTDLDRICVLGTGVGMGMGIWPYQQEKDGSTLFVSL